MLVLMIVEALCDVAEFFESECLILYKELEFWSNSFPAKFGVKIFVVHEFEEHDEWLKRQVWLVIASLEFSFFLNAHEEGGE